MNRTRRDRRQCRRAREFIFSTTYNRSVILELRQRFYRSEREPAKKLDNPTAKNWARRDGA